MPYPEQFNDFDPDYREALLAVSRGELTADAAREQLGIGRDPEAPEELER